VFAKILKNLTVILPRSSPSMDDSKNKPSCAKAKGCISLDIRNKKHPGVTTLFAEEKMVSG